MSSTQRIIKFKNYSIAVKFSIYKILKKRIYIKTKDIIKKGTTVASANKQRNKKQTLNKHRTNSKVFLFKFNSCQGPVQYSQKSFINLYAVSAKTLKTLRCLPKRIFST